MELSLKDLIELLWLPAHAGVIK